MTIARIKNIASSFIEGANMLFFGFSEIERKKKNLNKKDIEALQKDWQAVGGYINKAINIFMRQNGEPPKEKEAERE